MPTGGDTDVDKYINKHLYLLTTTLWCVINHLLNVYILLINAKSGGFQLSVADQLLSLKYHHK